MRNFILSAAVALGILAPAVALAQTASTGLLTVYVQVINQSYYSAFPNVGPSNFTVSVSGNTASLSNFQGSQSGTPVQLYPGSYNVTVNALGGYTPSYSVGCNNTIAAGQTQTCVVTMTPTYNYYPNTTSNYSGYPYYNVPPLYCRANTPSIMVGQPVTFTATGGAGGTYNWVAPYTQSLNYPNAGTQLTVAFEAAGQQTVQVTNAAQTTSCSVQVTQGFYPYGGYSYTNPTYPTPTYPTTPYQPTYPQLPRTGFGPHDPAAGIALSIVLLALAGYFTLPYARKAFAAAVR
jgi:hypothetical protein